MWRKLFWLVVLGAGCGPGAVQLRPARTCDGGNLEECRTRCDQNEARACYRLGWFYEEGQEVERNVNTALDLYQKACDAKMAIACRALGIIYARGDGIEPNSTKATESFKRACEFGIPDACESNEEIAAAQRADEKIEPSASPNIGIEVDTPDAPDAPKAPEAPKVEAPEPPPVEAPPATLPGG